MMLKRPTPGLRVFHNSNTAEKVEVTVPAGDELTVSLEVAEQLAAKSTHYEVDADELRKARDARAAEAAAEAEPEPVAEPEAEPVKKAAARRPRKSKS
jgi:deoxyribodipyrimidine photolyase